MPRLSGEELKQRLVAAGKSLVHPPSSLTELLHVLDRIQELLSKVVSLPAKSVQTALPPIMKALAMEKLLKHSDVDVRVGVASCISEIIRITAPDAPYDDEKMKDVFQLIVSSFENLSDMSSRSYEKRATILETMAKGYSFDIMVDLGFYEMIIGMFQHFLNSIRDYHDKIIFASMERIMSLVLDVSEFISVDLLTPILATLKRNNEAVMPIAKKLAGQVIQNLADILRPHLRQVVESLDTSLDDYIEVVDSVCQENSGTVRHCNESILDKLDTISPRKLQLKSTKDKDVHGETTRMGNKRKRTPGKEKAFETLEYYGENLAGSAIIVWRPKDQMFYEGRVTYYDKMKKKHTVLYLDGKNEILNLKRKRWEFLSGNSVSDGDQDFEHSSRRISSDMQMNKKGNTSSDASIKPENMKGPRSKIKVPAIKSGGKSKDDNKVESKSKNYNSKPSRKTVGYTFRSKDESQKLGGKGQVDSAKASGRSKDDVAKTSNHSKQDSQQTSKSKDDRCPILFVWDGVWECNANRRWKFIGNQSKTVLIPPNATFSQLLDKAYAITKVHIDEYHIEMSSWFAFQYENPLPPCPVADDDDVRVLIQANKEKTLSVPICLIMRKRERTFVETESESSNRVVVPMDTREINSTAAPPHE